MRSGKSIERPFNLAHMTLPEVRDHSPFDTAVLPWGSIEPHNLHLPYDCDTSTAQHFAEIGCEKAVQQGARVVLLPCIPIGTNSNFFRFPLSLNIQPSTELAILRDIVTSLEAHDIHKLVVFNAHGGNEFQGMLRELYGQTKVNIFLMQITALIADVVGEVCEDTGGEHANEAETACLMHLAPESVKFEQADDGASRPCRIPSMSKGWLWTTRPWHSLAPNSGCGNPLKATPEKGKKIVDVGTDRMAQALTELSETPIDENFPYDN